MTVEYVRRCRRRRVQHDRSKVFTLYNNRCACCGETEEVFLTLDHVNDDGAKDRKAGKDTMRFYREILVGGRQADFRLMCWNCNRGRWTCGECPHVIRARGAIPTRLAYDLQSERMLARRNNGAPTVTKP